MEYTGITNTGLVRSRNEDNFFMDASRGLFVVCDGMGGHKAGDLAAFLAVDTIRSHITVDTLEQSLDSLKHAINLANQVIWEQGQSNPDCYEMGTTITAALLVEGKMIIGHAGDSRLYILRNGRLEKWTRDHTLAEKMSMDAEWLQHDDSYNRYQHILTRALGVNHHVEVDYQVRTVSSGDVILMCTDGLYNSVTDEEIVAILGDKAGMNETAQGLMDAALDKGGSDNITLILIRL